MNASLFLLYCMQILGALLYGAQSVSSDNLTTSAESHSSTFEASSQIDTTSVTSNMSAILSTQAASQGSNSHSTSLSPRPPPTTTSTTTSTTTPTTTPINMSYIKRECLPVLMTAGGLIIACTILLISTMLLMCKVCQLSSRIKMLSENGDLISTNEYWMGTAKKSKNAPETGAKETTVLMADIGQTQEDVGNGAAKEEAAKANEDGQTGEEDKEEVADTAKSGETSTTPVVEKASSSKPQEEATDSQSVKAGAAPSSEKEKPKEEV